MARTRRRVDEIKKGAHWWFILPLCQALDGQLDFVCSSACTMYTPWGVREDMTHVHTRVPHRQTTQKTRGSTRFRLLICMHDAPPWGVRGDTTHVTPMGVCMCRVRALKRKQQLVVAVA